MTPSNLHRTNTASNSSVTLKPRARGWIHLVATPIVFCAVLVAIALPETLVQRISVAVFGASSVLLFGASAVYHRGNWSPRLNAFLRRLDHSNIFLLIAGTYTPLSVLVLEESQRNVLLMVIWSGALLGIVLRQCWSRAPRWVYVPVYIALGWVALWYLPDFYAAGGPGVVWLIILGGIFYTLGAIVYATKYPDFSPKTFGYHEVFHVYTILAWACHFVAILVAI